MPSTFCAAIDIGATSGRVIVGSFNGRRLDLKEVHRFPNAFKEMGAHSYWDLPSLWQEVRTGLLKAKEQFPKLHSCGVDTWGNDHVLVNESGRLVFPVHAYRDARTQRGLQKLENTRAALSRIYQATGIPNVFYNTSLQLAETFASCPSIADAASRFLSLPDYFNFLLSGKMEIEMSSASVTQLLDVHSADWSRLALDHYHIPPHLFSKPILAGKKLGKVRDISGLESVQVVAVPGHDTACAYDAMPATADGGDLFLSSGTWSLVGFESKTPVLGDEALRAKIANERQGDGRFRPLKNVIGLWLLEQTLNAFPSRPKTDAEWKSQIDKAAALPAPKILLDVTDPVFANPASMRAAIDAHLKRRKAPAVKTLAEYIRLICDSLGEGHAESMRAFERMTGRKFKRILIVGGGSKNRLLCQATADAAGIPVVSYNLEGSATGNIARQLISLGKVKSIAAFRTLLATQLKGTEYRPATARS